MIEWHDYLQIATLMLLLLLTIGRAIHLRMTQDINPITVGIGKKGLYKVVEICLLLGIILWAVVVLSFALHFERWLPLAFVNKQLLGWQFVKLIGAVLLICSLVIFILALTAFGHSWRVGIDEKTPGELVSRGVFVVTRNPIFLSLIVYASGTFLIYGRLVLLVFWVLIVAGLRYQVNQEEKFLLDRYGRAYEEYKARTGRYISFRRSSRA
jgi:protein-S-isoprenylcysteine O-methyltransferase Ste14